MQASLGKHIGGASAECRSHDGQRLWFNPGLSNRVYFGTGAMGLMLIIFPALLGALTTAKEYEMGTIIQAYASSLTAAQWILGKALLYVLIGLVEFVFASLWVCSSSVTGSRPIPASCWSPRFLSVRGRVLRNDDGQCHG